MADSSGHPDTGDETGMEHDRGSAAGRPPWQKVLGIIGFLVVVGIAIMLFVGGGHGPGRHGASSAAADGAVEIAVTTDGPLTSRAIRRF